MGLDFSIIGIFRAVSLTGFCSKKRYPCEHWELREHPYQSIFAFLFATIRWSAAFFTGSQPQYGLATNLGTICYLEQVNLRLEPAVAPFDFSIDPATLETIRIWAVPGPAVCYQQSELASS